MTYSHAHTNTRTCFPITYTGTHLPIHLHMYAFTHTPTHVPSYPHTHLSILRHTYALTHYLHRYLLIHTHAYPLITQVRIYSHTRAHLRIPLHTHPLLYRYTRTHLPIHLHTHSLLYMYTRTHPHAPAHTPAYAPFAFQVHTHTPVRTCPCPCIRTLCFTGTHAHTRAHLPTHLHTHADTQSTVRPAQLKLVLQGDPPVAFDAPPTGGSLLCYSTPFLWRFCCLGRASMRRKFLSHRISVLIFINIRIVYQSPHCFIRTLDSNFNLKVMKWITIRKLMYILVYMYTYEGIHMLHNHTHTYSRLSG